MVPSTIMNQKDKQTRMVNGRPGATTNRAQWSGRPSLLPKAAGSPASGATPSVAKSASINTAPRAMSNTKEIATPIKTFLNSNITPRSSSRKARKNSASSTPNGTPIGTPGNSRPTSLIDHQERAAEDTHGNPGLGIGYVSAGRISRPQSVVSDSQLSARSFKPTPMEVGLGSNGRITNAETQPMFFRADDVRPSLATIPSERYILQEKKAGPDDGGAEYDVEDGRSSLSISPAGETRPKFFYANGTAEPRISNSKLVTAPIVRSPTVGPQQQRATSPLKDEILSRKSSLSKASTRRHTRLVSTSTIADIRSPDNTTMDQSSLSRSSSLNSPSQRRVSHVKSSNFSASIKNSNRRPSSTLSDRPTVSSSVVRPVLQCKPELDAHPPSSTTDLPMSPTNISLGQTKLEHLNELAANARRERKVLDLEISNSSLLAINRTLEREMRKQNAELRRFRRLSRTNRISVVSSSRSTSNTLSMLSEYGHYSDSDEHSGRSSPVPSIEAGNEEVDDDSHISSFNTSPRIDSPLSPSNAACLRAKDSQRLNVDFSRHRALLVDSQKLNQCIKRCLSRTEDLITNGKKALEYCVETHELETRGARVLLPDELEHVEMGGNRQGLLSPGVAEKNEMAWEDAGVELAEIKDGKTNEDKVSEDGHLSPDDEDLSFDILNPGDPKKPSQAIKLEPYFPFPSRSSQPSNPDPDPDPPNEWARIASDVQTPDELPPGGPLAVHSLRDYLSSLGEVWRI